PPRTGRLDRERSSARRLLPAAHAPDPTRRAAEGGGARGTVRRVRARARRGSHRPVRRDPPRAGPRARLARRGGAPAAPRAGHADAGSAAGRAQEARPPEGPQALPVLEALTFRRAPRGT